MLSCRSHRSLEGVSVPVGNGFRLLAAFFGVQAVPPLAPPGTWGWMQVCVSSNSKRALDSSTLHGAFYATHSDAYTPSPPRPWREQG